jgi:hypothetical protein
MSAFHDFAQALYDSGFGTALRESQYAFPLVEGTHLLSLAFSVGLLALIDLRLTGLFLRRVPAAEILTQLRPWVLGGFAVTFLSGSLLFWATSIKVLDSPVLPVKFLFILLSGLNFLWFEFKFGSKTGEWKKEAALPGGVRFAGAASLLLWSVVVLSGRLIPYLG